LPIKDELGTDNLPQYTTQAAPNMGIIFF